MRCCVAAGEHGPTPAALREYETFRQPLVRWQPAVACTASYRCFRVALTVIAAALQMEVVHRKSVAMFNDFNSGGKPPQVGCCWAALPGGCKSILLVWIAALTACIWLQEHIENYELGVWKRTFPPLRSPSGVAAG